MSEHDLTQDAPATSGSERMEKLNAVLAESSASNVHLAQYSKARTLCCGKYGATEAEFAEYWKLRYIPAMPGERDTPWNLLLDRLRKRLKARTKPRKNADLSSATAEEKAARKRGQDNKAQKRHRAKLAAEEQAEAIASGSRPMSGDELAVVEAIEAAPAVLPSELDALLASLVEAEAREKK